MARSKEQLNDADKARFSHRRLCFCLEDEIQAKADAILKDKKKSVKNIAAYVAKLIVDDETSKSSSNTSRSNEELQKELHMLQNKLDSLTTLMITTQNYMQQLYSNGQILPVQNMNPTPVYESSFSSVQPAAVSQTTHEATTHAQSFISSFSEPDSISKTDSLLSGSTPETNVSTAPTSSYPDFEDDNDDDDDMDEIYNSMKMF